MSAMLIGDDEKVCRLLWEADELKNSEEIARKYPVGYDHKSLEAGRIRYKEWFETLKNETPESFLDFRKRNNVASKKWYEEKKKNDPEYIARRRARDKELKAVRLTALKNNV
jgi:hypothetical protein